MVLTNGLGRELVERMGWCLLHSVWQLAAIAAFAAIVLRGLRHHWAQARYAVAYGALAGMALLPALPFVWLSPSRERSIVVAMGRGAGPPSEPALASQRPL